MKILMINSVCGIRSTGRICTDLAAILEEHGHEVKIAYGREEVPAQFRKYAVRIGSNFDVQMHALKARFFDKAGFGSKIFTERFIKWIKEYDPDVIHLHNIHGYYINIDVLFSYLRVCGKKIIWTLHDCWAFTGHSAYCDAFNCEKWQKGCDCCPQKNVYPKSYVDRSKFNWFEKKKIFLDIPNLQIVTPSKWLANLVKKSFLCQYPVTVINNGIDTSKFSPIRSNFCKELGLENKKVLLGVASTWNEMKGYLDFIKLASMLDDTYRIVLVGVTKKQKKMLNSHIIGIEKTNSIEELSMIYSACDLFINLTYCDTFPTVNLEAIACGKNVISYSTGGCPESINVYGYTVPKGDITAVLTKIKEYFDDPIKLNPSVEFIKSIDKSMALKKYVDLYF